MAIQQSKKQSDLEKRLQLLRRQVYGGNKNQPAYFSGTHSYQLPDNKQESGDRRPANDSYSAITDLTYLHRDLLKILIFASFAIGAEIILFLLVKNNVFTLVFR